MKKISEKEFEKKIMALSKTYGRCRLCFDYLDRNNYACAAHNEGEDDEEDE